MDDGYHWKMLVYTLYAHPQKLKHDNQKKTFEDVFPIRNGYFPLLC